ncbi:MAG: tyrosine-type recombinase/integrase [Ferruginibacter sp.]
MEKLILKAVEHNGNACIGIYFTSDKTINALLQKNAAARWSRNLKCWHVPLSRYYYDLIVKAVMGKAIIDHAALSQYLVSKKTTGNKTILVPKTNTNNTRAVLLPESPKPATAALIYKGSYISAVNTTVIPEMHEYLKLKSYSSSTIRTYLGEMRHLLGTLQDIPAQQLQAEHIKRYLVYCHEKLHLTENTLHSRMNALKFYYEQVLGREKFFWEIPRPKKPLKLPKVISEEKILAGLLAIENIKHRVLLLLAYSAGMRVSEVISLQVTDIDSDRMEIRINRAKGKKDRVVTLSQAVLPVLRTYYKEYRPKKWLFEGPDAADHYSSRSAQQIFKDAYRKLGLPPQCSFHSLRHSYATHLLENGTDISIIQRLLGHNDIKTTLRYAQVSNRVISKIESPLDRAMRKKGN